MAGPNRGGYWLLSSKETTIDATYLTHVYFAFLNPDKCTFEFVIDEQTSKNLKKFTDALKKFPCVKKLLSIGGAADGLGGIFSEMVKEKPKRDRFICSAIKVAEEYGFDGLDFDWEFPETKLDMANLGLLLGEWRQAVNDAAGPKLLLSAATFYKKEIPFPNPDDPITYPVKSMNKNLDWINVMCYDYHGLWGPKTGTLAALNAPAGHEISTSHGLNSWINDGSDGMSKGKLVMGLPLYGRSWELENPEEHDLGAPAKLKEELSYKEVVDFKKRAKEMYDPCTDSYYSFLGSDWISYDTVETMERKIEHAKRLEIGGYFFWEITNDKVEEYRFSEKASVKWSSTRNPNPDE